MRYSSYQKFLFNTNIFDVAVIFQTTTTTTTTTTNNNNNNNNNNSNNNNNNNTHNLGQNTRICDCQQKKEILLNNGLCRPVRQQS